MITITLLLAVLIQPSDARAPSADPADDALRRVVDDYVGLYRRETLPRWRELFLSSFSVASTNPDGSTRLRGLDEFYAAQEGYLASGREIREVLENTRFERRGRLASVWADFVLSDAGEQSRGRLVLLLIQDRGAWRIHSLMFSYDAEP
jgi:hypothetical protein